jgi:multisubunit Na+/H+ antiporter MnhC subunit
VLKEAGAEAEATPRARRPIRASAPRPSGPPALLITAVIIVVAVVAFLLLR